MELLALLLDVVKIGTRVDLRLQAAVAVRLVLGDLEAWELVLADGAGHRTVAVCLVHVYVFGWVLTATEVARDEIRALVHVHVEEGAPGKLFITPSALGWRLALALMPVDLSDRELLLTESAPGRPGADRLMPVDILRWEAVLAAFARLEIVAMLFVGWQLAHREDNLAEAATAGLFAAVRLMVDDLVGGELAPAESTPDWALVFIASPFVLVKFGEWLLDLAEATSLGAAVTTVRCRVSSLDADQADWAVIVWQVRIGGRLLVAIGWVRVRRLDVNINDV